MNISPMMKVAQVLRPGAASFDLREVPTPAPGLGQILIRVESCGVNFSDVKRRRGDAYPFETTFPFVPGAEVAGEVAALGAGVDGPPVGTPVFALAGAGGVGGYAQYALSYAHTVIPIPQGLSHDVASILMVAGSTAHLLLHEVACLRKGESVLIPAAAGGVGSFALQLARQAEAGKIIAVVGDASKVGRALELGAHEVVVCSASTWPEDVRKRTDGKGVDMALEASGGEALEQTFRCLASFGRLVVYGAASGVSASLSANTMKGFLYDPAPNQTLISFNLGGWFMERPRVAQASLTALIAAILSRHIEAPPIAILPLEQAAHAHKLLESRKTIGKLVIKPWA